MRKALPLLSLGFCFFIYAFFELLTSDNSSFSYALENPPTYETDFVSKGLYSGWKSPNLLESPFQLNALQTPLKRTGFLGIEGVFIKKLSDRNDTPHLIGKTIVIDPGHGGYETGAIQNFIEEQHVTLDVSLKLKSQLESEGARVIMTRNNELSLYRTLPLSERAAIPFKSNADVFLSIHFNSHPNNTIQGTETYYNKYPFNNEQNPFPSESERLANSVQNNLVQSIHSKNLGIKESDFHVLRNNTVPSVLVEIAFLSNENEAQRIKEVNYIEKSAFGISQGVIRYFTE